MVQPNATRLNAAGKAGTIDPFNLAASSPAAIADVMDNMLTAQAVDDLLDLRVIAEGKLMELPGGDARLAVGAEYMYDDFALRSGNDIRLGTLKSIPHNTYSRNVKSAFGELLLPVITNVEISAAARYDDYQDFGSTFNPKIGISLKPVDWFTLRGNWGTSFTAPTPLDQLRSQANTVSAFPFVAFTRPGDTPSNGSYTVALQGSRPNLQPQEADTWSVGFDARPQFIPGLGLKLSYYNVKFRDILATPTPGVGIFTNFPDNIQTAVGGISAADLRAFGQLAPGGSAVVETLISQGRTVYEIVDFRTGNFGAVKVDGLDFGVELPQRHRLWRCRFRGGRQLPAEPQVEGQPRCGDSGRAGVRHAEAAAEDLCRCRHRQPAGPGQLEPQRGLRHQAACDGAGAGQGQGLQHGGPVLQVHGAGGIGRSEGPVVHPQRRQRAGSGPAEVLWQWPQPERLCQRLLLRADVRDRHRQGVLTGRPA